MRSPASAARASIHRGGPRVVVAQLIARSAPIATGTHPTPARQYWQS